MTDIYRETRSELLTKIVKTLAIKSSEVGEMVELYMDCQDFRIRNANRERTEAPSELAEWLDSWMHAGETVIKNKLDQWVRSEDSPPEAKWAYEQIGIGPVIASGLSAYIDVTRAPYPSSVWKFAGLAPGYDRKQKGVKLPYNSRLKVLCVRPDQLVTTRRGYVPICEIQVGDEVLTHRGRYRRVTQLIRNEHHGRLIGLRAHHSGGRIAWLTDNHPVYVNRRATCKYFCEAKKKWRFRSYENVQPRISSETVAMMRTERARGQTLKAVGEKFGYSQAGVSLLTRGLTRSKPAKALGIGWAMVDTVLPGWQVFLPRLTEEAKDFTMKLDTAGYVERNGLYYAQGRWPGVPAPRAQGIAGVYQLTAKLARFIGLFVAEGSTTGNHITWSFHSNETDYIAHIKDVLRNTFNLNSAVTIFKNSQGIQITAGNKMLVESFRKLFGVGAAQKHLPQQWLEARPDILASLIRGIFEGDGCLEGENLQLGIISKQLSYWVIDALARFGIRSSITFYNSSNPRSQKVYKLTVHDREAFMSSIFGVAANEASNNFEPEGVWQTARYNLEESYRGFVYNLEVEEDHSYVVEGYAVHNCWKIGESFVKVSGKEGATYGELYGQFKAKEIEKNEGGLYRETAGAELERKKFKTDNVTKKRLLEGKLSDGHLHARAKRKTVKIFLSHYWQKGREARGLPVPGPYAGDILGHSGMIAAA